MVTDPPLAEAVSVAIPSDSMTPPVAVNVADVAPGATVTDDGTLTVGVSEANVTERPLAGASPPIVTVQLLDVDGPTDAGAQERSIGAGR